jgi:hypothetical protein
MRKNTFGGMHCQRARLRAPLHKFTMRIARLEPQNLPFFTEFFNRYCRHPCRGDRRPAYRLHHGGMTGGLLYSLLASARGPLVKFRQIQPATLLLFEDFQPRFQLFQAAS